MLLKLSKWLSKLSLIFKSNSLYFKLNHYIKHKQTYLEPIRIYQRGIGKSYALVKLAIKYKCPIYTGSDATRNHLLWIAKKEFNKNIEVIKVNEHIRGKRRKLGLIEEGINSLMREELIKPRCEVFVGYDSIDREFADNRKVFEKEYYCKWGDDNHIPFKQQEQEYQDWKF